MQNQAPPTCAGSPRPDEAVSPPVPQWVGGVCIFVPGRESRVLRSTASYRSATVDRHNRGRTRRALRAGWRGAGCPDRPGRLQRDVQGLRVRDDERAERGGRGGEPPGRLHAARLRAARYDWPGPERFAAAIECKIIRIRKKDESSDQHFFHNRDLPASRSGVRFHQLGGE